MSAGSASAEKRRLRNQIRCDLESILAGRPERAGIEIDARLRASRAWSEASEIVAFVSLPAEVDTRPLIRSALEDGKRVLLPRMVGERGLEFAAIGQIESLVPGRFGVREPGDECPPRPLSRSGLILVPGLAFDRRGGRLGRGAGYYDRALVPIRRSDPGALCIGLGFALQLVESVPMTPLDVRLDGIVTEEEFLMIE
jgi:5-formyltetrahydrofolate cyclo-ligase